MFLTSLTSSWFILALIAGLFYTFQGLITRHILKGGQDAWAFSFYFSFFGMLVSLPFALSNFSIPQTPLPWLALLVVGILIVGQNLLNFKANNYLEASLTGTVNKFRLIWIFILGIFLLHEPFSLLKLIGTIITVSSGLIIIRNFKKPDSVKGLLFAFGATLLYATVIVIYKFLFNSFNSSSLTFFIFLLPATINLVIMPNSISRIYNLFKSSPLGIVSACSLGGFANLAMNRALSLGEISKVNVIIEAFLVATLAGEHLILKERSNFYTKIIAVALATIGAILIRLG